MSIRIALAGNPNSGKTTLFNALTGSNQYVGNWPGVTVEKKEGDLKKHDGVIVTDLPGIYSLSPYTLEEVVARNYLVGERPDAILNIIDGTNLERNLYLTTQLAELGIPMVIAINMMDVVRKNGDEIDIEKLSKAIGCRIIEISALKSEGISEAAELAIEAAKSGKPVKRHMFCGTVEHALAHIEEAVVHDMPEEEQRWYAIKIFERDSKVLEQLRISESVRNHIENDIKLVEEELDDDAEAIITNERYEVVGRLIDGSYRKKNAGGLTISDKIDMIVTNRFLGLPVFALIMFLIYYISMSTIGAKATDWTNDCLFGDGFHLFGIGSAEYDEAVEEYGETNEIIAGGLEFVSGIDGMEGSAARAEEAIEAEDVSGAVAELKNISSLCDDSASFTYSVEDGDTLEVTENTATMGDFKNAVALYESYDGGVSPENYGKWVNGIPVVVENMLESVNCADWLENLIIKGIIGGVGSVLGFVPQMFVLFFLLSFVESCGYMSRVAFVLDRIFRHFGLSGKSFIPILVGTGCGVPGIMASRTIENVQDRRMTIITTTFIPCGAKTPFIAMIAGAIFGGSPFIALSAYFLGIASIIVSGIILKKTKMFASEPAPFVMELPSYHMPTAGNILRPTWERGWSFIKKAGTVILLSTVVLWFLMYFGFKDGSFGMLTEEELDCSILATVGKCVSWLFIPLGWGKWQTAVATVTGLIAKENIVGTLGVLFGTGDSSVYDAMAASFTSVSAYSFLAFNLLCAPCFAAMGAIRREMNDPKWTFFAIGYQCGFAYIVSFIINQLGNLFTGNVTAAGIVGAVISAVIIVFALYMIFKPYKPVNVPKKVKVA